MLWKDVPTRTVDDGGVELAALGLEKVDLFGFSLGGGVAQMVALQAPDLVRRMILAGTGPRGGEGIDEILKKTGRDKRISLQARLAQVKAIRAAGKSDPDDLSLITQPVFVADGDHDLMVASSHSADKARRLPNARPTIYPDSGHWSLASAVYPGFDSYQRFTDRRIPVAVLDRRAG